MVPDSALPPDTSAHDAEIWRMERQAARRVDAVAVIKSPRSAAERLQWLRLVLVLGAAGYVFPTHVNDADRPLLQSMAGGLVGTVACLCWECLLLRRQVNALVFLMREAVQEHERLQAQARAKANQDIEDIDL